MSEAVTDGKAANVRLVADDRSAEVLSDIAALIAPVAIGAARAATICVVATLVTAARFARTVGVATIDSVDEADKAAVTDTRPDGDKVAVAPRLAEDVVRFAVVRLAAAFGVAEAEIESIADT